MLAFAALPALLELLPLAASASASGVNSSVIGRIDGINRIDGVNGIDRIDRVNRIVGAVMSHYSPAGDRGEERGQAPGSRTLGDRAAGGSALKAHHPLGSLIHDIVLHARLR
jgi:hypothetical protein